VQSLHGRYLHRSADAAGLSYGVSLIRSGDTLEQLAGIIVTSTEYAQINSIGTNDTFLNDLFRDALNRPVDPATRAWFDQAFSRGESRGQAADQVLHSDEYRQDRLGQVLVQSAAARGGT